MSALFHQAEYAEDQRLSRVILGSHVLHRGFQAGAIVGMDVGIARALYASVRRGVPLLSYSYPLPASAATSLSVASTLSATGVRVGVGGLQTVLRSTGVGAVVGTALMVVALPLRMRGRDPYEWQDRSWRLLANKGQVEVDTWSAAGSFAGAVAAAAATIMRREVTRGPAGFGWRGWLGCIGLGNAIGVLDYIIWRHGLNGGKFPGDEARS